MLGILVLRRAPQCLPCLIKFSRGYTSIARALAGFSFGGRSGLKRELGLLPYLAPPASSINRLGISDDA